MCISGLIHVSLASGTVNCLDQQKTLAIFLFWCKLKKKKKWCQGKNMVPKEQTGHNIFSNVSPMKKRVYVPHPPSQIGEFPHNSLWENISANFQKYILAMRFSMLLCSVNKSLWPGQGHENIYKGINLTKINIMKFNILKSVVFGWCLFLITCLIGNFQRLLVWNMWLKYQAF